MKRALLALLLALPLSVIAWGVSRAAQADGAVVNPAAPLLLTTMTHMEGSFDDDQNYTVFRIHVEQLRYGMNVNLFTPQNETQLRYFLMKMRHLETEGFVTWATQGEVLDVFNAWNTSR